MIGTFVFAGVIWFALVGLIGVVLGIVIWYDKIDTDRRIEKGKKEWEANAGARKLAEQREEIRKKEEEKQILEAIRVKRLKWGDRDDEAIFYYEDLIRRYMDTQRWKKRREVNALASWNYRGTPLGEDRWDEAEGYIRDLKRRGVWDMGEIEDGLEDEIYRDGMRFGINDGPSLYDRL
jgi:hypothetical protein